MPVLPGLPAHGVFLPPLPPPPFHHHIHHPPALYYDLLDTLFAPPACYLCALLPPSLFLRLEDFPCHTCLGCSCTFHCTPHFPTLRRHCTVLPPATCALVGRSRKDFAFFHLSAYLPFSHLYHHLPCYLPPPGTEAACSALLCHHTPACSTPTFLITTTLPHACTGQRQEQDCHHHTYLLPAVPCMLWEGGQAGSPAGNLAAGLWPDTFGKLTALTPSPSPPATTWPHTHASGLGLFLGWFLSFAHRTGTGFLPCVVFVYSWTVLNSSHTSVAHVLTGSMYLPSFYHYHHHTCLLYPTVRHYLLTLNSATLTVHLHFSTSFTTHIPPPFSFRTCIPLVSTSSCGVLHHFVPYTTPRRSPSFYLHMFHENFCLPFYTARLSPFCVSTFGSGQETCILPPLL